MQVREFKVCNPVTSNYARRISKAEWEKYRPYLKQLHDQGLTRLDIVRVVRQKLDFDPSYGQLNSKFREWGLKVYGKNDLDDKADASTSISEVSHSEEQYALIDEPDLQALDLDIPWNTSSWSTAESSSASAALSTPSTRDFLQGSLSPQSLQVEEPEEYGQVINENLSSTTSPSFEPSTLSSFNETATSHDPLFENFDACYPDGDATLEEDESYTSQARPASSAAEDILSLWTSRVGRRTDPEALKATLHFAASLHSTGLFEMAFLVYKDMYTNLSQTAQGDDILRIGALVHCVRSACTDEAFAFVKDHLATTIEYCENHWSSEDMRSGKSLYSYLLSLQTGIVQDTTYLRREFHPHGGDHSDSFSTLIANSRSSNDLGCVMFAHVLNNDDMPDPVVCMSLVEVLSRLLAWCFLQLRPPRPTLGSNFDHGDWCNLKDRLCLVREIAVFLYAVSELKGFPDLVGDRGYRCKCDRCHDLIKLFKNSPMELFTAVGLMVVDKIQDLFGDFVQSCDSDHLHLKGSIPLDRAVSSLMAEVSCFDSFEDVYHSVSKLRDFLSSYQARFEAYFVTKQPTQTDLPKDLATRMMDRICTRLRQGRRGRHNSDSSVDLKIRASTLPARQWLRKLSDQSRLTAKSTRPDHDTGMKRPRSAVSSLRVPHSSRASSLRSFEQLAKRIKSRSSLSIKSTASRQSRSSSQRSWSFSAVTGFGQTHDIALEHRIDEQEEESIVEPVQSGPTSSRRSIYSRRLENLIQSPSTDTTTNAADILDSPPPYSRDRAASYPLQISSYRGISVTNRSRSSSSAVPSGDSPEGLMPPDYDADPSERLDNGLSGLRLHDGPVVGMPHF